MQLKKFNSQSGVDVSLLLFGGRLKVTIQEPELNPDGTVYTFKSGKRRGEIKLVNRQKYAIIKGLGFKPDPKTEILRMNKKTGKREPTGIYQTNEGILSELLKTIKNDGVKITEIDNEVPWDE